MQCIDFLFSVQTEATLQTGRLERSQHLNCVVLWNHRQWQRGRWSNFSVVHGRPEFLVVPLSWRSQDSPNTRGHWTRSRGYGNDDDDDDGDDENDEDDGDDDLMTAIMMAMIETLNTWQGRQWKAKQSDHKSKEYLKMPTGKNFTITKSKCTVFVNIPTKWSRREERLQLMNRIITMMTQFRITIMLWWWEQWKWPSFVGD